MHESRAIGQFRTAEILWVGALLFIFLIYAGSYFAWSRLGMIRYAPYDMECYVFIEPTPTGDERMNGYFLLIYSPLIAMDRQLGTGVDPCGCPTGMSP